MDPMMKFLLIVLTCLSVLALDSSEMLARHEGTLAPKEEMGGMETKSQHTGIIKSDCLSTRLTRFSSAGPQIFYTLVSTVTNRYATVTTRVLSAARAASFAPRVSFCAPSRSSRFRAASSASECCTLKASSATWR